MISSDFPTYDDPSYDEYSGLRNAMLDLRSAANHVIYHKRAESPRSKDRG